MRTPEPIAPEYLTGDPKGCYVATTDTVSSSVLLGEEKKVLFFLFLFFYFLSLARRAKGRYVPTREFGEG